MGAERHHLFMPEEIVKKAWAKPDGISFASHDGHSYRIKKDKKMVIVSPDFSKEALKDGYQFHIAVFPRPELIGVFKEAERGVAGHGTARFNPGSVGTIILESRGRYQPLNVSAIQSSFRSGGAHGVGNKIGRAHLGWMERGLTEAMDVANDMGREIEINNYTFYRGESEIGHRPQDRIKQLDHTLEKLQKEHRVTMKKLPLGVQLQLPRDRAMVKKPQPLHRRLC